MVTICFYNSQASIDRLGWRLALDSARGLLRASVSWKLPSGVMDSPNNNPAAAARRAPGAFSRGELPSWLASGGWLEVMGLELVAASAEEVIGHWTVDARHLQPQGLVHGGVYASVVETCCSVGALLAAPAGQAVVGVENHTSFLRPVRAGRLSARAVPLHAGRRAQLWECSITDEARRLVATGRLRALCVDAEPDRER